MEGNPKIVAGFLSDLIVRVPGGFPFTLVEPLGYISTLLARVVVVPAGFQTDLASIPRGLWNVLPKVGKYDKAAVVHDYLYRVNGCTRKEADQVMVEAMNVCKVGWFTQLLIYVAVRMSGERIWRKYRNAS